jgi:hypothetical protein
MHIYICGLVGDPTVKKDYLPPDEILRRVHHDGPEPWHQAIGDAFLKPVTFLNLRCDVAAGNDFTECLQSLPRSHTCRVSVTPRRSSSGSPSFSASLQVCSHVRAESRRTFTDLLSEIHSIRSWSLFHTHTHTCEHIHTDIMAAYHVQPCRTPKLPSPHIRPCAALPSEGDFGSVCREANCNRYSKGGCDGQPAALGCNMKMQLCVPPSPSASLPPSYPQITHVISS